MFAKVAGGSLVVIFGMVFVLMADPYQFIDRIFLHIDPVVWGSLGIVLCCGFSILGAGLGMYITGSSLMGAAIHRPSIKTKHLITILFCEAVAIYGVVFSIILSVSFTSLLNPSTSTAQKATLAGYSMFWSGATVGIVNLAGGICVGTIGSSTAVIDAQNPALFIRLIILEVLASAVGLFGLISGFIQISAT